MKIEIDLENSQGYDIFLTKEDYDADSRSPEGYKRYQKRPWGTRGAYYRFFQDPCGFPCAYFHSWTWDNPNGPYEDVGVFLPIKITETD